MTCAYWLILLGSALFPFFRSFGPPLYFNKKWRFLFPAIFITALPFLIWDAVFTYHGNWGFNERYITGFELFGLPIEEISFFIVIPYCCMFIYEIVLIRIKPPVIPTSVINSILITLFVSLLIGYYDRAYTAVASAFSLLILLLNWIIQPHIMRQFYLSFVFMLIPFLVVNGLLTGSILREEIVWYNDSENLGLRLFTIPLDDFIYCFGMMLSVTGFHEFLQKRSRRRQRA